MEPLVLVLSLHRVGANNLSALAMEKRHLLFDRARLSPDAVCLRMLNPPWVALAFL